MILPGFDVGGVIVEVIPASKAPRPGDRLCITCGRARPADQFYGSGTSAYARRRTCIKCIHDAQRRERVARGGKDRHPRYNARGEVWCNDCQQYLGAESFKRHPSRPGTYWAYCRSCTRIRDRKRYADKMRDFDRALADIERRTEGKRRRQAELATERRTFLQDAILLLRRRGLTKAEITRLTGTSISNLLKWERGETRFPSDAVCRRFGVVVRATMGFPIGDPVRGRRLPHPAMAELLAVCLPQVEAIPVRNAWKGGRR